ncbi:MAG: hypothetical protein OEZ06_21900 [Myxococcales bacterium]|nr:hypothetical protein [Myxococcales bacterium]
MDGRGGVGLLAFALELAGTCGARLAAPPTSTLLSREALPPVLLRLRATWGGSGARLLPAPCAGGTGRALSAGRWLASGGPGGLGAAPWALFSLAAAARPRLLTSGRPAAVLLAAGGGVGARCASGRAPAVLPLRAAVPTAGGGAAAVELRRPKAALPPVAGGVGLMGRWGPVPAPLGRDCGVGNVGLGADAGAVALGAGAVPPVVVAVFEVACLPAAAAAALLLDSFVDSCAEDALAALLDEVVDDGGASALAGASPAGCSTPSPSSSSLLNNFENKPTGRHRSLFDATTAHPAHRFG